MEYSFHGYSLSAVVEVRDRTLVKSDNDRKELQIRVLHKDVSVILPKNEESCLGEYPSRTGWNLCADCFPILASRCCEIPEGRVEIKRRHIISV